MAKTLKQLMEYYLGTSVVDFEWKRVTDQNELANYFMRAKIEECEEYVALSLSADAFRERGEDMDEMIETLIEMKYEDF